MGYLDTYGKYLTEAQRATHIEWLIRWGVIYTNGQKIPDYQLDAMYKSSEEDRGKLCNQIPEIEKAVFGKQLHGYDGLHKNFGEETAFGKELYKYSNKLLLAYRNYLKDQIQAIILGVEPSNENAKKKGRKNPHTEVLLRELASPTIKSNMDPDSLSSIMTLEQYIPIFEEEEKKRQEAKRNRRYDDEEESLLATPATIGRTIDEEIPPTEVEYEPDDDSPEARAYRSRQAREDALLYEKYEMGDVSTQEVIESYIPWDIFAECARTIRRIWTTRRVPHTADEEGKLNYFVQKYESLSSEQFDAFASFYNKTVSKSGSPAPLLDMREFQRAVPISGGRTFRRPN